MAGGGASAMHIAHVEDRLHSHTTALNCYLYSKHSYIRLCGQWCVVDKVNGTATLTKLVCVRSQKRTLAEQEIPELSRVCSAITTSHAVRILNTQLMYATYI